MLVDTTRTAVASSALLYMNVHRCVRIRQACRNRVVRSSIRLRESLLDSTKHPRIVDQYGGPVR